MIAASTMGNNEDNSERIARIEATIGDDGDSGMRGELREIKNNQVTLFERIRAMEIRGYAIGGGAIVVIWLIEHAAK